MLSFAHQVIIALSILHNDGDDTTTGQQMYVGAWVLSVRARVLMLMRVPVPVPVRVEHPSQLSHVLSSVH